MIEHIVLFRLKDEVTPGSVDELFEALYAVAGDVDGVLSYRLARDAGLRETGNEDIALVAQFRDEEAFNSYLTHPQHLAVLADAAPRLFEYRHGIQLRI